MSIIPSSPMLITPERSEKVPPMAAKAMGVAMRIEAVKVLRLKMDGDNLVHAPSPLFTNLRSRSSRIRPGAETNKITNP